MSDGRWLAAAALLALAGASKYRGSRGLARSGWRSSPACLVGHCVPIAPIQSRVLYYDRFPWRGKPEVIEPGIWDNDDGPGEWYAVADDDGIHLYTSSEDLAFFLARPEPLLTLTKYAREDPLCIVGPLPLAGRDAPRDAGREPDGWWRVESAAGVGIAYVGAEDKARLIASYGPRDPF